METSQLKHLLIEMIECTDDDALLYDLKEDFLFQLNSRSDLSKEQTSAYEDCNTTQMKQPFLRVC